MSELTDREREKLDEIQLDLADEERRAAEQPVDDGGCPDDEHCGNDCGGVYDEDSGDREESVDCVHCECCTCTPCSYARVA